MAHNVELVPDNELELGQAEVVRAGEKVLERLVG